jgi:hypothetical protein
LLEPDPFSQHFLFSIRGYDHNGTGTPPGLAFSLQKLSRPWGNLGRSLQHLAQLIGDVGSNPTPSVGPLEGHPAKELFCLDKIGIWRRPYHVIIWMPSMG